MVSFGRISLLYYNLDYILPFKNFVADYGNVDDANLFISMFTSSRLKKSTGGTILSAKVFMNSKN